MRLAGDRMSGVLKIIIAIGIVFSVMGSYSTGAEATRGGTSKRSLRLAKLTVSQKIALNKVIAVLRKEYKAAAKDPNIRLRSKSDYFGENPSPEITPEVVLNTITLPVSEDPGLEAYIRWQLLSALPEKVEPEMEQYILTAYQEAPKPFPQLGMDERQKRQLETESRRVSRGNEDSFSQQVIDAILQIDRNNFPIISYRLSLFERLPANYETIEAGLRDVYERAKAGADVEEMLATIAKAAETWRAGDAKPEEMKRMNFLMSRLMQETMPTFYDRVNWDEQTRRFNWHSTSIDLGKSKGMETLAKQFDTDLGGNGK